MEGIYIPSGQIGISIEERIWKSMLDVEYNLCRYKLLGKKYFNFDKFTKIFLAIMASGTVASWTIWKEFDVLWGFLSALSAVIAISIPIINLQSSLKSISNRANKLLELKIDYNILWDRQSDYNEAKLREEFYKIKGIERQYQLQEGIKFHLTLSDKEKENCQEKVLISRGLINN